MTLMPTWDQFMVPILKVLADGSTHRARDILRAAADLLDISDELRLETINSGQPRYLDRASWALYHLFSVGALDRPARGTYQLNRLGAQLLRDHPDRLTDREIRTALGHAKDSGIVPNQPSVPGSEIDMHSSDLSPDEQISLGVERLHSAVAAELLGRLHANEPEFFEQAVLDLIMAMGYGGAEGTATRTQLSNDGGIDGIVDQDALGLSRIYVQAKRYKLDATIGRPEIQAFVGALHGNQANQGVFITTATFSSGTRQYAESVPTRVVLIDGRRMASLMIRYGVGVQVKQTVQIVEVDEDFFE